MEEISVDLADHHFVIVNPGIHVSTAEAFNDIVISSEPKQSLKEIITQPVVAWRDLLKNEFEISTFKKHPLLPSIKNRLYESGASYAAMTGTGSSVYGIFHNSKKTANLLAGEKYSVHILNPSH